MEGSSLKVLGKRSKERIIPLTVELVAEEPMGLFGSLSPARLRRMALEIAELQHTPIEIVDPDPVAQELIDSENEIRNSR